MKTLLVCGGAGFIGSNFTRTMLQTYPDLRVVVYDKLTYAGRLENLQDVAADFAGRYAFVRGDIGDRALVEATVAEHGVDTIVNFAAETHVDRSILDPDAFIRTSCFGTYTLLEVARERGLRFHQISTDEVYGHIRAGASVETDPLAPRSPYSASKASADLLTLAYFVTYGVPVTITRGANNVGPYQYPEKVVPLFVTNALEDRPLPVYGDGQQMRDYQYVLDHCEAIDVVLRRGQLGEVYNVGTGQEIPNLEMVEIILNRLGKPRSLIHFVEDRQGHDRRYSLNVDKLSALGWTPRHTCQEAIAQTVDWYMANEWWWRPIKEGDFRAYYERQYGSRAVLGVGR
ncbi:MAG: dTDP-glucose 4,6-dehydratase [Anaerolineae bacterium]|nr:dTDP-glucose 4,6-dehydratase [Anaerolineae bacterium]